MITMANKSKFSVFTFSLLTTSFLVASADNVQAQTNTQYQVKNISQEYISQNESSDIKYTKNKLVPKSISDRKTSYTKPYNIDPYKDSQTGERFKTKFEKEDSLTEKALPYQVPTTPVDSLNVNRNTTYMESQPKTYLLDAETNRIEKTNVKVFEEGNNRIRLSNDLETSEPINPAPNNRINKVKNQASSSSGQAQPEKNLSNRNRYINNYNQKISERSNNYNNNAQGSASQQQQSRMAVQKRDAIPLDEYRQMQLQRKSELNQMRNDFISNGSFSNQTQSQKVLDGDINLQVNKNRRPDYSELEWLQQANQPGHSIVKEDKIDFVNQRSQQNINRQAELSKQNNSKPVPQFLIEEAQASSVSGQRIYDENSFDQSSEQEIENLRQGINRTQSQSSTQQRFLSNQQNVEPVKAAPQTITNKYIGNISGFNNAEESDSVDNNIRTIRTNRGVFEVRNTNPINNQPQMFDDRPNSVTNSNLNFEQNREVSATTNSQQQQNYRSQQINDRYNGNSNIFSDASSNNPNADAFAPYIQNSQTQGSGPQYQPQQEQPVFFKAIQEKGQQYDGRRYFNPNESQTEQRLPASMRDRDRDNNSNQNQTEQRQNQEPANRYNYFQEGKLDNKKDRISLDTIKNTLRNNFTSNDYKIIDKYKSYQFAASAGDIISKILPEDNSSEVNKRPANLKRSNPSSVQSNSGKIKSNYQSGRKFMSESSRRPISGSERNMTMENYLAKAYKANPEINAAREALKAADEAMPQALSGFLPNLAINTSNSYTRSEGENAPERSFSPNTQSLTVTQGVFGGGETYYAMQSAKNRIFAARYELDLTEQQFILEAINAYIEVIFTKKVLLLAENNEAVLNEQLKASKERFIIGDATRTDVAQSEARLANAVSNRVISARDYTNAKSNFRRIFLSDPPSALPMPTSLPNVPESFDQALTIAINNNPQINRAKFLKNLRESEIDESESTLYPQVDIEGSISKRDSVFGANLIDTNAESIALNVNFPLYQGGARYSRIREAQNRANQSDFDYQNTINSTRDGLIQAWQNLTTTAVNIEATKASLVASEFALEGVREEQKEGLRTILEVLDAERERFQSEVSHARAIKDSVLAIYDLKSVLGQLTVEDLNLPIKKYDPTEHYEDTKYKFIGL
jgi:outer membrane protein